MMQTDTQPLYDALLFLIALFLQIGRIMHLIPHPLQQRHIFSLKFI